MSLSKEQVKAYLIRDKGFLKELYKSPNELTRKRSLKNADDMKLNTLIKYLHFIANGEIKIKAENFKIIQESNKLKLITKTVEQKAKVLRLLKSARANKLQFLIKLNPILPPLLFALFNEQ